MSKPPNYTSLESCEKNSFYQVVPRLQQNALIDTDWSFDPDDNTSIAGYVVFLGQKI